MPLHGVLFDFSGTLFRFDPVPDGLVDESGRPLTAAARAEVVRRMTAPAGHPDGLPDELSEQWERRDLEPALHRELYGALLRGSGVGNPAHLYDQLVSAEAWEPYPDTVAALKLLADRSIAVAVISNIAWDIEPVFARFGIADRIGAFVLSYREGAVKPDPRLFATACARIGVVPGEALMIGDSATADGAAAEIGCEVALVDAVPVDRRPRALLDALAAYGLR